jgi:hypothetical protein
MAELKKKTNEDDNKKNRDAAVVWLRDKWYEAPPNELIDWCIDLLRGIVDDYASNAAETTPHLSGAIRSIYEIARDEHPGEITYDQLWQVVQVRDKLDERRRKPPT